MTLGTVSSCSQPGGEEVCAHDSTLSEEIPDLPTSPYFLFVIPQEEGQQQKTNKTTAATLGCTTDKNTRGLGSSLVKSKRKGGKIFIVDN